MARPHRDFAGARECHAALRALVIEHPGGWHDEIALRKANDLCRTALSAVNDMDCIAHIGRLEDLARELFSEGAHEKWQQPGMLGVAVLKLEMLKTLLALRSQLAYLEGE